ncbi:MAG: succinyl-diaminopimelate desuccinylase [Proteobacteria bacterium]|nr:succinyl-diaminopimelate desuccinylase [Pseudomonadota bacterium]
MNSDPTIELLCDLIRRRSVTPDDAGCQELLIERLEAAGFDCESMPFSDVTNLWARRGCDSPVLCFAGHTDVVPPGAADAWESDPFEAEIRNGNLYGRGAADMKSSLAAMIVAIERFVAASPDHRGSIALLITSDEEGVARNGTLKVIEALSQRGESIDWCVIGEPSSHRSLADVVRIGRRGSLSADLIIKGVQGHVAYPDHVDNPIRRFAPVLAELHNTVWDSGNENFPPTSFQVVDLRSSGGAANVTPQELHASFNFRYSTEWNHQDLQAEVVRILDRADIDYELAWHLSGEPFLTGPGALIDAVVDAVKKQTGSAPELSTGGGTSDGRFIAPSGAQVVELGPVNASIHKVNEHVKVADVPRLAIMYQQILENLLHRGLSMM